jgi:predicted DNA-binding transcriptional regulator AlpA
MPNLNELMDPEDCRKEGKFARATFYDKLRNGTGPKHMRIGRLIRIRRPDWEAWLQSCEVDPGKRAA